MFWERKDDIHCLSVDWTVIGTVFPWNGHWAAAFQNETMKTARTFEQARAYVEKYAQEHHRKLEADDFRENGPDFVPNYRFLNALDRELVSAKRESLKRLEF